MHTIEELKTYLTIDKHYLEEELLRQAQLFAEAADLYADASEKSDQSKQFIEQVAADLSNQFRESCKPDKVTDSKVKDHVNSHTFYVEKYAQHLAYKAQAEKAKGLKDAFAQRASALRDLVVLFNAGYWGTGLKIDDSKVEQYKEAYKNASFRKPTVT